MKDRRPLGAGPDGGPPLTPPDDTVLVEAILGFRSAMAATGRAGRTELEDLADFLR